MIRSKHLYLIVFFALIIVIIIAAILWFRPSILGIAATSNTPQYERELFDPNEIMTIDIQIDEDSWQDLLDNASKEEYYCCDVVINGTPYSSIGIRAKGNTSLSSVVASNSDRYSFKLKFDKYIPGQNCMGLDKFVINNIIQDTTYMKEYLSYDLLNYIGVPTPLYSYASISVNGEYWGCYLALEALEESFAERQFGLDHGMLYKVETVNRGGGNGGGMPQMQQAGGEMLREVLNRTQGSSSQPQPAPDQSETTQTTRTRSSSRSSFSGADLVYTDDNSDNYYSIFDNAVFQCSESDYQRVIEALKHLNERTDLERYVDVDEVLRYIAGNTVLVNLDSYFGNMKHNYYLYEKDSQISILPWDYNLSFGAFQSNTSNTVNFPIDTPVSSSVSMEDRPLINQLLSVDEYMDRYHEYLQQILDGYFNNGYFYETIDRIDQLISPYVKDDPTAFYSFEEYQASLPMLKLLGELRTESIQGQLDGTIPSTSDGQSQNPENLVDSSELNMSLLGSQGGGGNRQRRTTNKENTEEKTDSNKTEADSSLQNSQEIPSEDDKQTENFLLSSTTLPDSLKNLADSSASSRNIEPFALAAAILVSEDSTDEPVPFMGNGENNSFPDNIIEQLEELNISLDDISEEMPEQAREFIMQNLSESGNRMNGPENAPENGPGNRPGNGPGNAPENGSENTPMNEPENAPENDFMIPNNTDAPSDFDNPADTEGTQEEMSQDNRNAPRGENNFEIPEGFNLPFDVPEEMLEQFMGVIQNLSESGIDFPTDLTDIFNSAEEGISQGNRNTPGGGNTGSPFANMQQSSSASSSSENIHSFLIYMIWLGCCILACVAVALYRRK